MAHECFSCGSDSSGGRTLNTADGVAGRRPFCAKCAVRLLGSYRTLIGREEARRWWDAGKSIPARNTSRVG